MAKEKAAEPPLEDEPPKGSLREMAEAEEPEGQAADEQQDEPAEPDEEDDAGGQADGEDDPQTLVKFFDENYGFSDAQQFADDHQWLRSVAELKRKIGERNEDASLGKQLRDQLGGEAQDAETMLAQAILPQGKTVKEDEAPEWNPNWLTVAEDGKARPAMGAPKDVFERYDQYQRWAQERLHSLLTDPEKFVESAMAKKLKAIEERTQTTEKEIAEDRQRTELEAACTKHRNLLYVGGDPDKGMTPVGEQIAGVVHKLATDGRNPADVLEETATLAAKLQPKQTGSRAPSKRASRQPSVAAADTGRTDEELDKLLAKRGGLSQYLQEAAKAERAATAG